MNFKRGVVVFLFSLTPPGFSASTSSSSSAAATVSSGTGGVARSRRRAAVNQHVDVPLLDVTSPSSSASSPRAGVVAEAVPSVPKEVIKKRPEVRSISTLSAGKEGGAGAVLHEDIAEKKNSKKKKAPIKSVILPRLHAHSDTLVTRALVSLLDDRSVMNEKKNRRLRYDSSRELRKDSTKSDKSNKAAKNGCYCGSTGTTGSGGDDDLAASTQMKAELDQCKKELEELKKPTPSWLFVLMADVCKFEKDEDGTIRLELVN